jgi:hypothetical protein
MTSDFLNKQFVEASLIRVLLVQGLVLWGVPFAILGCLFAYYVSNGNASHTQIFAIAVSSLVAGPYWAWLVRRMLTMGHRIH